jgi:hypothetical protein
LLELARRRLAVATADFASMEPICLRSHDDDAELEN